MVDTLLQHGARVDLKNNVRNYIYSLSHYMHVMHITKKLLLRILTLNNYSYYVDFSHIALQL